MTKKVFPHLAKASDLVTPYANTRAGFIEMALEKNSRATPYVLQARVLVEQVKPVKKPLDLFSTDGIRGALLTAAGISDKAATHFDRSSEDLAIEKFIEGYLIPAGSAFREELVYRFLLTRGDSLGGAMRNIVGALAQRRFTEMLMAHLGNMGLPFSARTSDSRHWIPHAKVAELPTLDQVKYLSWESKNGPRVLAYNQTIPIVKKNIDMSLLACDATNFSSKTLKEVSQFLALGELKGGIDPAGADEHWKTAHTALNRIRNAFEQSKQNPALFFVAAAIEQAMAAEIWAMLLDGKLNNAANLTVQTQLSGLCDWIVSF